MNGEVVQPGVSRYIRTEGPAPKAFQDSAWGFNPDHYAHFVAAKKPSTSIGLSGKHRSTVRIRYRLEAYATLLSGSARDV
jgi:hypothetical protein